MKTLFKNLRLLDFESDKLQDVDILVEDGVIREIKKDIKTNQDNIVNLKNNIVIPGFANCFYRSLHAFKDSYLPGENADIDENLIKKYMNDKNMLAGVCFSSDFSFCDVPFVENIDKYGENELDEIALNIKDKIFIKVGQTLQEMGEINAISKKMPSEFLEDFGFLDKNAVIVGGNCFEKDELELLSSYGTKFVLLPNDDARSGRRFANMNSLKKYDIPFGIGSGDFAEIDFFAFMRQLLSYNAFVMEDVKLLTEKEVLKIATVIGAEILGFDGRIEKGNYANFIVLNEKSMLNQNVYKAIIYELSKQDVLMTIKNGKIIQQNGVFVMENSKGYDKIYLRSKIK